jgi:hypothetical protein
MIFINSEAKGVIYLSGYALHSTSRKMQLSDFAVFRAASLRLRSYPYPVLLKVFQRGNVFQLCSQVTEVVGQWLAKINK